MANIVYRTAMALLLSGGVDLDSGDIRVALLGEPYLPVASHATFAEVEPYEVSGPGYAAGGQALSGRTVEFTDDESGETVSLRADDARWAAATFTARWAVVYDAASGMLVALHDLGAARSCAGTDFVVQWSERGVILTMQEQEP